MPSLSKGEIAHAAGLVAAAVNFILLAILTVTLCFAAPIPVLVAALSLPTVGWEAVAHVVLAVAVLGASIALAFAPALTIRLLRRRPDLHGRVTAVLVFLIAAASITWLALR